MTGLNHAVTGAFVSAAINKPILSLPAALASHFIVDVIPHWNYGVKPHSKRQMVMVADLALSLGLLLILAMTVDANAYLVFFGGLVAMAPDTMWMRFFIKGRTDITGNPRALINRIRKFHLWIQWSETSKGLIVELLWFPLMLWLIYQVHP